MKRLLQTRNKLTTNKDLVSRKEIRGKDHIVVSGVSHMIGDAVMNQIHYPAGETIKLSNSLGNKRIVMPSSHPTGDEGEFISASDPLALMSNFVGAFAFNFSMRGDRLISDIAIDPEVANRTDTGKQIINAIENGDPIDVSTGFFLNIEDEEGFGSDGEPFLGVASNLFLDHVAFLPNEIGAKNKFEGVGLHVNSAIDNDGNGMDTDIVELFTNASVPAMNLPLAPADHTWDETAAVGRVREFSKSTDKPSTNYRKFFLAFDQDDAENFGAYRLPFVDIIDSKPMAVKAAIDNAKARLNQTQISDDDKASALSAIESYQAKFDNSEPKANVLSKAWNVIKSIFVNKHELSHDQIQDKIFKKLNEGRLDDQRHLWPVEVFDDNFIYHDGNDKLFRQSYAMVDDDVVFVGDRTEVERVVEYKTVTNNNGDRIMREKILAALNAAKVKTEGLDDDALFAAYNDLTVKEDSKGSQNDGLTLEDLTKAINAAVKPLKEQLTANADKEQSELASQVVKLDIGIDEEAAKAMSVNALNSVLAKNGTPAFSSAGYQHQVNTKDSCSSLTLPTSKAEAS
jgi:hypothetical protein